ncbi:MAG: NAD(P)-dependent oxidoreductase [Proteobacteria bacterium]|nr:NAD(P)-dependent oxidoreductase [Pseudomonadota bacterium]
MKILITGGAGYLGSTMSEYFLDNGHEVTVYDNLMYKQCSLLHLFKRPNFKFIQGDIRDSDFLKLIPQFDFIIPLAAIVGMPACRANPDLAVAVNFTQIKNIVDNISSSQGIIIPNTNSQYGSSADIITEESDFKPLSLYAQTKCDAEDIVAQSGKGIILRLATVFGPSPRMRQDLLVNDFVYKAVTDGYLVLFESHFKRNYIHVEDIAKTFNFLVDNFDTCKNQIYNVGLSSANLTKLELAEKIKLFVPGLVIKQDDFKEDFDKRNYIVSNEKLEKTGWRPTCTLEYGIQQLIECYSIIITHNNRSFTNL